MKDAALITTKAFPAAAANNAHDPIDLGPRTSPKGSFPGEVELEIAWPTLAALVEAKDIDFTVEDSASSGSGFASLGLTHQITGGSGNGLAAGTVRFRLPRTVRQYVRVTQAVETGGGNNTAASSAVSLVFGNK